MFLWRGLRMGSHGFCLYAGVIITLTSKTRHTNLCLLCSECPFKLPCIEIHSYYKANIRSQAFPWDLVPYNDQGKLTQSSKSSVLHYFCARIYLDSYLNFCLSFRKLSTFVKKSLYIFKSRHLTQYPCV